MDEVYTTEQATEDGILVSVAETNPDWGEGPFSHITANLMSHGYYEEDGSPRLVNLMNLLNQALTICRGKPEDWLCRIRVEFPVGELELQRLGPDIRPQHPRSCR